MSNCFTKLQSDHRLMVDLFGRRNMAEFVAVELKTISVEIIIELLTKTKEDIIIVNLLVEIMSGWITFHFYRK